MNAKDLKNLRGRSQKIIKDHIKKYDKTESGFAKECGIHPAQLLLYMRSERGLTVDSLMKVGDVICDYEKN